METFLRRHVCFKLLIVVYAAVSFLVVMQFQNVLNMCIGKDAVFKNMFTELKNTSNAGKKTNTTRDVIYIQVNHTNIVYRYIGTQRYGPGDNGQAVKVDKTLLSAETLDKYEKSMNEQRFDTFVSDVVSVHRQVPDIRSQSCKDIAYPDTLPPVSVIFTYRGEWPGVILRGVYSVLQNTPDTLLEEIILVDDGSWNQYHQVIIDMHVAYVPKLKLVRYNVSEGLMRARQAGIKASSADYFVVMDGHMEVGPGWLEPMVYRLVQEPKNLLSAHIGGINKNTFAYRNAIDLAFVVFPFFDLIRLSEVWLYFNKEYIKSRANDIDPVPYGMVQGMVSMMRKDYFIQLGGFDTGMRVWGSEQIELSVKVWMCGGRVEMIPCSKVAHLYRSTPWGTFEKDNDYHSLNKARVAEVWMDPPYKDLVKDFLKKKNIDLGEIESRHKIRRDNNCKPYQYFLDRVREFSDVFIPGEVKAKGQVINVERKLCLDVATENKTKKLIYYSCHKTGSNNQYFILTEDNQIRTGSGILIRAEHVNINGTASYKLAVMVSQVYNGGDSKWSYQLDNKRIVHNNTTLCLSAKSAVLGLEKCSDSTYQQWDWTF